MCHPVLNQSHVELNVSDIGEIEISFRPHEVKGCLIEVDLKRVD